MPKAELELVVETLDAAGAAQAARYV